LKNTNDLYNYFNLGKNHAEICTGGMLSVYKEKRIGLYTEACLRCNMCNREYCISSDPGRKKPKPEINKLALYGTVASGATFSHVDELFKFMEIPFISQSAAKKLNDHLSDVSKSIKRNVGSKRTFKLCI